MPHESPPHAFVIAQSLPLRRLDHAAEFAAFEQQPRGLPLDPVSRCAIFQAQRTKQRACRSICLPTAFHLAWMVLDLAWFLRRAADSREAGLNQAGSRALVAIPARLIYGSFLSVRGRGSRR